MQLIKIPVALVAIVLASNAVATAAKPGNELLARFEARQGTFLSHLETAVAVAIRELANEEADEDWWKGIVKESEHIHVGQVLVPIRNRVDLRGRHLTPRDIELDFVCISTVVPDFEKSTVVEFVSPAMRTLSLFSRKDTLQDTFLISPSQLVKERKDGVRKEPAIIPIKGIGSDTPVTFESKWLEGAEAIDEQVGRLLDNAPMKAKVYIMWHEKTAAIPAFTHSEIIVSTTRNGWK